MKAKETSESTERKQVRVDGGMGPPRQTFDEGRDAPQVVELVDLSKVFRRGDATVHAIDHVNLRIRRGDFCAFVGPSGCGKSTLLNLIGGLDHPTSGDILLNGRSTLHFTDADWTEVRRTVLGIVFQAFHLIPSLTAAENVALPLALKGQGDTEIAGRVEDVLRAVGMVARRHHRPSELSGGEQQRVALARAIVHRPTLILADEPTGNLDSKHGAEIISLLGTLSREYGHTVLLVTHSWDAVQAADYVWEMRDGRLVTRTPVAAQSGR